MESNNSQKFAPSLNFNPGLRVLIQFREEIRTINKNTKTYFPCDINLLAVLKQPAAFDPKTGQPLPKITPGLFTGWFNHVTLRTELAKLGPLKGKEVEIENLGKVKDKPYYGYEVKDVTKTTPAVPAGGQQ